MDKHIVFIIDEEPLLAALRKYGKGPESKDYEFAVSIYMKRKLEQDYKEPFCIVFDVKPGKNGPSHIENPTPEETIEILREMLEENTPVDFGLVKGTVVKHETSAFAFQVKKFIGNNKDTFNLELVDYIHKILAKYRPGEASLIIVPNLNHKIYTSEEEVQIDIDYLRQNIEVPNGSFQAIFILIYNNNPIIKQLWPEAS